MLKFLAMLRTIFLTLFAAGLALAADPFGGTWKPNIEKAKPSPDGRVTPQRLLKMEAVAKNHYRRTFYQPDGKPALDASGKAVSAANGICESR
jgi:hypothetical protein